MRSLSLVKCGPPAPRDGLREIQLRPQLLQDLRSERNYLFRSGDQIEPLNFSILVVNDFLAAGEEGVPGKNVAGKE